MLFVNIQRDIQASCSIMMFQEYMYILVDSI